MEPIELRIHTQEIIIPGLQREYRFLHITDSHIVLCDKEIFYTVDPNIGGSPASRTAMFTSADGVPAQAHFDRQREYLLRHAHELDGLLLTGDILDFNTPLSNAYLEDFLTSLPIPYLMALGNHDRFYYTDYKPPQSRPDFECVRVGDSYVQKLRIGELTLVGVDDTISLYEDGVAEALEEMLVDEQHVLLLQHVPLYTPALHEAALPLWGRDLSIGGEALCRNDNWRLVQKQITRPGSPVRAVIAGHLHFLHSSVLGGNVTQYVSPSVHDVTTLFHIHG